MAVFKYTSRDFATLKQEMVAQIPSLAPLFTNMNEGDLGMLLINLLAATGDMLAYTQDRLTAECFLPTALTRQAVQNLTRLIDYKLARPTAAKTLLRFSLEVPAAQNIVIPAYTRCRTVEGVEFVTREDVTLFLGNTFADVEAYQGSFLMEPHTGTGEDTQFLPLRRPNVASNFLIVDVAGQRWVEDRFDTSTKETLLYEVNTDINEQALVRFSRHLGEVPAQNANIVVRYVETRGAAGNIGSGLVKTIVTDILGGAGLKVTNTLPATGGKDRETLDEARVRAPRQLRSLNRAVTVQDFVDLLESLPRVAKVQALNHNGYAEIYVAPEGGGDLFVAAPTAFSLAASTTGGTLAAGDKHVLVTAVDVFGGETAAWEYNPSDRAVVARHKTETTTGSTGSLTVTRNALPAGATGWKVYVGDNPLTMRLAATKALADTTHVLTEVPTAPAPLAPHVNTTGIRTIDGASSLRLAAEEYLEERRLIGTVFALFNPVYVPVDISATVKVYENYKQLSVKGEVDTALREFFKMENREFGEDLALSTVYSAIMAVPGVRSVKFTAPTDDVPIADGAIAALGTLTLTMEGGVA